MQIGGVGSRKGFTVYNVTDDIVQCGCWNEYRGGSLEEFKARVEAEYNNGGQYYNCVSTDKKQKHYAEYKATIAFFETARDIYIKKEA